jgi:hypothetical protein
MCHQARLDGEGDFYQGIFMYVSIKNKKKELK